jgi:Rrf2 family nitric oxide-sensitive transcriptional repressor
MGQVRKLAFRRGAGHRPDLFTLRVIRRRKAIAMQLTIHSDYALRVLLYLKLHGEELATIQGIADAYGISKNHLMKVVQNLTHLGYVDSSRGRNGGIRLAQTPKNINLGEVVRKTEPHFNIAECFDLESNTCPIVPACDLTRILAEARNAFLKSLDQYSLADLGKQERQLRKLLEINGA